MVRARRSRFFRVDPPRLLCILGFQSLRLAVQTPDHSMHFWPIPAAHPFTSTSSERRRLSACRFDTSS
jgi:hypothetical protein